MYEGPEQIREIKRKLRELKKLELKIRFGDSFHAANIKGISSERPAGVPLIWDGFFEVSEKTIREKMSGQAKQGILRPISQR